MVKVSPTCTVKNCNRSYHALGYCGLHYNRNLEAVRKPLYSIWTNMKDRCYNQNCPTYQRYGGRGIKVCDRWLESYENFARDMGERPKGKTLDRIDNDGNYEPSNCRWATQIEQILNRSIYKNSTTGVVGVHWMKNAKKWSAHITSDYKTIYLGLFSDIEKAIEARRNAELKYHAKAE